MELTRTRDVYVGPVGETAIDHSVPTLGVDAVYTDRADLAVEILR